MFRSFQIIIMELCSLLKLCYSIHNSIGICKRCVVDRRKHLQVRCQIPFTPLGKECSSLRRNYWVWRRVFRGSSKPGIKIYEQNTKVSETQIWYIDYQPRDTYIKLRKGLTQQPKYGLNKIQFMTSIKLLHVSALGVIILRGLLEQRKTSPRRWSRYCVVFIGVIIILKF